MSKIEPFQSDKVFVRTHFNNFGTLLVFTFYSQANEASVEFKNNFQSTIPIFGDHENVKYYFIALEICPQTFKKYDITQTPTTIFTQTDKKVIKKFNTQDVGVIFDALNEQILVFRDNFAKDKTIWHPKIKSILNESQVVVFIKGTADAPKCGFTETLLKILEDNQISFTFYDIMADQYMRYWLRNYCNWPTYPQIHCNGQLIGGLDVCKELVAKGQFLAKIPKNCTAKLPEDRLKQLVGEYKVLLLTDKFTYCDQATNAYVNKVKSTTNAQIKVYNVSLDQNLKKVVNQTYQQNLPIYFVEGVLQNNQG